MRKVIFVSVLALISVFAACSKSSGGGGSAPATCTTQQSFSGDVNPIIQGTCAVSGCHDAVSSNGPGSLITYQRIFDNRAAIKSAVQSGAMPKNGSLSSSQKSAIICWIDQGAPNN